MSFAAVLRSYATQKDPSRHLPASVHLLSNDDALTIFDKYPKAKYHFLVLPRWPFTAKEDEDSGRNEDGKSAASLARDERPQKRPRHRRASSSSSSGSSEAHGTSITDHGSPPRTSGSNETASAMSMISLAKMDSIEALMCQAPPEARRQVLRALREMGDEVVDMIRDEMIKSEGFEWSVEMGFHIVPSIQHLHLHVISNDLVSDRLTTKKHYNSFKPNESYFLKLGAVEKMLGWTQKDIDREISRLLSGAKGVLARPLSCHKCGETKSTMPTMKEHLEDEWRREGKASRRGGGKKAA